MVSFGGLKDRSSRPSNHTVGKSAAFFSLQLS